MNSNKIVITPFIIIKQKGTNIAKDKSGYLIINFLILFIHTFQCINNRTITVPKILLCRYGVY